MNVSSEVLARKYRPSNFDELIGQESIAQTLSLALDSNRLSHAYLFSGLRGSGKTSTARIFAKALTCEQGMSHQPCGICQNCKMAIANTHMDIIEMDGASSRKIDDIRDLIEQTKYRPVLARYKIFIIDEVHMLTKEAFNALLKTLEEPPEYIKFILATTDPLKLPATILSRTQHFRFKSIATRKIIDHLAHILHLEKIEYEQEALEIIARSGSGSLRDTLTLLDQAIVYSRNYVDVNTVTDMLGLVDPKFLADLFVSVFAKDIAKLVEYTKVLEDYEAEMVIDELIAYLKEKMYMQDAMYSTLVIDRFFRILSDSKSLLNINADGSFVLSMVFFKMVEALKIKDIDQIIETFQKDIKVPQISAAKIPAQATHYEQIEVQAKEESVEQITQEVISEPVKKRDPSIDMFSELIVSIKDRNYKLGECFESSVTFISYEESVLTWESCANKECKQALKHGYSAIKQLVRELFGFNTKIKGVACASEVKNVEEPKIQEQFIQPQMQEQQVSSMVEESEIGGSSSCVTNCDEIDLNPPQEIDGNDIMNQSMVQQAIELFEAKKVTVQSKI